MEERVSGRSPAPHERVFLTMITKQNYHRAPACSRELGGQLDKPVMSICQTSDERKMGLNLGKTCPIHVSTMYQHCVILV
ncbi:MAG: hypothetical protein ACHQEM_03580 [Chitinophagales bacterium]